MDDHHSLDSVGYSQTPRTKLKTFTETLFSVIVQRTTYLFANRSACLFGCSSLYHPILWKNIEN